MSVRRKNSMEIPSGLMAFAVIIGIAYWVNSNREEKIKVDTSQAARDDFLSLVNELDVDGISDALVQWLEGRVRLQTGKDLSALTEELRGMLDEEDGKKQVVVQLMLLQQHYLEDRQNTEERMQWHRYVEVFRQMNKAQQKHEIERLKKIAEPGSTDDSEKLNSLELIYLGNDSKTTDVMVGGVKLFTLKEK